MTKCPYVYDDGGRYAAGFRGRAGDCVVRAVAIASGKTYQTVYEELSRGMGSQRRSRRATARNGVSVKRKWFRDYMLGLGFFWTPTMSIGSGCRVHLISEELPKSGRLVLSLSKHYVAMIDGVLRDTADPTWATIICDERGKRMVNRCVYGYWSLAHER